MSVRSVLLCGLALASGFLSGAVLTSEIAVKLKLDHIVYVDGERVRGVIDVANSSPDSIDVGSVGSEDRLIIECLRQADGYRLEKLSGRPFTAPFTLHSSEGQKLEVFLGDHFQFVKPGRYLTRAVLIHGRTRYEGAYRSFDVVPGLRVTTALQMFKEDPELKREFELVHWGREQVEHLFLKTKDSGSSQRRWVTADLGPYLAVTPPKLSVQPSGEIITLHRATQEAFIRSVFWSLPEVFEFNEHEQMVDPEVAGAERVKELYREAGGVEPVKKAWWKFW